MKELKNLKELVETIHNLYSSYEDIGLLIEMGYVFLRGKWVYGFEKS